MFESAKGLFSQGWRHLTPAQQQMYAREKLVNFRYAAKMLATRSRYVLTSEDLAPPELHMELTAIGQFAEVAYNFLRIEVVFGNLESLMRKHYPLEGYDSLVGSELIGSFTGKVADVPGYVAFKPSTKQLFLAISGTRSASMAFYDVYTTKTAYPGRKGCYAHTGFWKLYKGLRRFAIDLLKKGLTEHGEDVKELVLTGHSMGGAMASLLALELLSRKDVLPETGVRVKVVTFGAPRVGTEGLVTYWLDISKAYREKYGEEFLKEYAVKGYNDGVSALPPYIFGFCHFAQTPLYFIGGRLYHIPTSEREHGIFTVTTSASDPKPLYPRGGHNYYNDRDMEKFGRRMRWFEELMGGGEGKGREKVGEREERYLRRVRRKEELRESRLGRGYRAGRERAKGGVGRVSLLGSASASSRTAVPAAS